MVAVVVWKDISLTCSVTLDRKLARKFHRAAQVAEELYKKYRLCSANCCLFLIWEWGGGAKNNDPAALCVVFISFFLIFPGA